MTLDELARSLPNGLHDAELHKCTIDYATRSVQLVLKVWVGRPEQMEAYRPATINLTGLHFWIIEPPDPDFSGDEAWLVIDTGEVSNLENTPAIHLPDVPQTAFVNWIYVRQWNAFMYVAAETAHHRWTGPEEDHGNLLVRGKPESAQLDLSGGPDFHLMDFADPTLLVPGTEAMIVRLAYAIASDRPFSLRQAPSQGTALLTIKPTDRDIGTMIETDGHFLWEISQQEARQCYAALLSLAKGKHPAHQYLDPGTNETDRQIVVSLGEYGRLP